MGNVNISNSRIAPLALKIRTQSSVVSIAESLGFSSGIPKSLTLNEQLYSRASSIYFASNSTLSDKRDKRVDSCEINCFVSLQLALRSSYSSPKKLRDFSASKTESKNYLRDSARFSIENPCSSFSF